MQRPRFTIVPQSAALAVILTCVYLLSYAPVYRYSPAADAPGAGALRSVYGPVERVIDSTPLREPLLVWSDWWGVRENMEWDSQLRQFLADVELEFGENAPLICIDPEPVDQNPMPRALPVEPGWGVRASTRAR